MSISSVPWTRSLGLSGIKPSPLGYQEEHTPLLLVVKRRRPQIHKEKTWELHRGRQAVKGFGANAESNLVQKTNREAGIGTWSLGLEVLPLCLRPFAIWRLYR